MCNVFLLMITNLPSWQLDKIEQYAPKLFLPNLCCKLCSWWCNSLLKCSFEMGLVNLEANMMPFNFDVHSWNWFTLDLSEKSSYFLVFSCCQGRFGNFSKCWKMWHFLFFMILINPQLEIHEELNFDVVDTFVVCRKIYHFSIGPKFLVAWIASYDPWKLGTLPIFFHNLENFWISQDCFFCKLSWFLDQILFKCTNGPCFLEL